MKQNLLLLCFIMLGSFILVPATINAQSLPPSATSVSISPSQAVETKVLGLEEGVVWIGTLKKCTPSPTNIEAESCGKCYSYFLEIKAQKEIKEYTFNDKNFSENILEKLVGKQVRLIGYENKVVSITCPIQITATKIELVSPSVVCIEGCTCQSNNTTCSVKKEKVACPAGCQCSENTTACPLATTKPVEAQIETTTGIKSVSIERAGDKLSIKTEKASVITAQKVAIEESKLYLETTQGNKQIKVLPEEVSLKTGITTVQKIELVEESQKPIYSIEGTKQAKILFLFPVRLEVRAKVSAENGEVIAMKKPWWSFLAW